LLCELIPTGGTKMLVDPMRRPTGQELVKSDQVAASVSHPMRWTGKSLAGLALNDADYGRNLLSNRTVSCVSWAGRSSYRGPTDIAVAGARPWPRFVCSQGGTGTLLGSWPDGTTVD
jgi:hypothetical protein